MNNKTQKFHPENCVIKADYHKPNTTWNLMFCMLKAFYSNNGKDKVTKLDKLNMVHFCCPIKTITK